MANVQMTAELKVYKSGGAPAGHLDRGQFRALIVKLDGATVLVERNFSSTSSVVEEALEKVTAEFDGTTFEVSLINLTLNDGEKEYLTDKFGVVFT